MMIKSTFFVLGFAWLISLSATAQREIRGTVYCGNDREPLMGAFVRLGDRNTKTDGDGSFVLPYQSGEELIAGASGYYDLRIKPSELTYGDKIDIYLPIKPGIKGLGISEEVEKVYTPDFEFVFDYHFLDDHLIIGTYFNKKLNKKKRNPGYENCVLTLFDNGVNKHRLIIPDYPYRLRSNPYGDLYLEGADYAKRIIIKDEKLTGLDIDFKDYLNQILPLTVAVDSSVFWVKIVPELPQVVHYVYSISLGREIVTRIVRNKEYFERTRGDYAMLSNNERQEAMRLAEEKGFSTRLYSTFVRKNDFTLSLAKPYSPSFAKGDTVYIFDPMNHKIYSHDKYGSPIDSVYFDAEPGDEKIGHYTQDQVSEDVYAIMNKGGETIIRRVGLNTGGLGAPFTLGYPFAENIRVYNGYVYYIRRDVAEGSRHIYRERLNFLR